MGVQQRVAAGVALLALACSAPWWPSAAQQPAQQPAQHNLAPHNPAPAARPATGVAGARPAPRVQGTGPLRLPEDMPRLVSAAQAVRARYGVPVSVTLAQALHESGNGRSLLATRYGNLYGVKCGGRSQAGTNAVGCVTLPTQECRPACSGVQAPFRRYACWQDSVADYGRILATLPAYRPAFAHRADPVAFARAVAAGGYATDPAYAAKLADRVAQLRRYDR